MSTKRIKKTRKLQKFRKMGPISKSLLSKKLLRKKERVRWSSRQKMARKTLRYPKLEKSVISQPHVSLRKSMQQLTLRAQSNQLIPYKTKLFCRCMKSRTSQKKKIRMPKTTLSSTRTMTK